MSLIATRLITKKPIAIQKIRTKISTIKREKPEKNEEVLGKFFCKYS